MKMTIASLTFALFAALTLPACGRSAVEDPPGCDPACPLGQVCIATEDADEPQCIVEFTGGGPQTTTESCSWLSACIADCDDTVCTAVCEAQVDEEIRHAHSFWSACLQNNCEGLQSDECVRAWCAPQAMRCFGVLPGEPLTVGPLACAQIAECVDRCADDACATECRFQGTERAQEQLIALDDCLEARCAGADATDTCPETQCLSPMTTCFGPGPDPAEGTANCTELHACVRTCSDNICVQNCNAQSTFAAQQAHRHLIQCGLTNCVDPDIQEIDFAMCYQNMCGDMLRICFEAEHQE